MNLKVAQWKRQRTERTLVNTEYRCFIFDNLIKGGT